ncbi:MAG TPA: glutamate--tRNA ligase [Candidatus Paceibacterota bacterium]|nr:glutamate--tRNA ligase [Candidatus Paceibacterota bacterium]
MVTRFAPSPTGFMHVGSLRTALYAWLFARQQGGRFILRIEDTDKEREVAGSIPHIIESLQWLGIEWDEGVDIGGPQAPYLQSKRLAQYHTYAEKLLASGHAYPDPYTEAELESLREKALAEKRPFLFRDHRPDTIEPWDGTKPLRFRAPRIMRYEWDDLVRGHLQAGDEAIDDFILIKSDGYPTYNFAHVVDDILMGVTHVMRGEEFISSTPKFLSLYEALAVSPPAFVTMPVILGPDGKKKLSKRDGAKDILDYRTEGYLPEAMMNFLALLGWNPGTEQEFFSKDELIQAFTLERIQVSGAGFDEVKLRSINQHWMRTLSVEEFITRGTLSAPDIEKLKKAVPLLQDRAQTFIEAQEMLTHELSCLFYEPNIARETLIAKEPPTRQGMTKMALESLLEAVEALPEGDFSALLVKDALMPLADAEEATGKGGRGGTLWPLRYALSGQERSPDPFTLIFILGKTEALSRIRKAIAIVEG